MRRNNYKNLAALEVAQPRTKKSFTLNEQQIWQQSELFMRGYRVAHFLISHNTD
jgi:hypothetical protein